VTMFSTPYNYRSQATAGARVLGDGRPRAPAAPEAGR
jgi:hypothetical protein